MIFGRKRPKPEKDEPEKLSRAVESSILGTVGGKAIPAMPSAAQKAFQLATDPNAEARDFIDVIESDEALSARVLKIANSVYFDRGKPSNTVEESVLVIGINELRCLLNASSLSELFPSKHPYRRQFWTNDIATAIIAKTLAQRLLPSSQETCFLAGLMHDIGKLLLVQRASDLYEKVVALMQSKQLSFAEAEGEVFVFDHTEAGQLIAERWNFTPELIDAIRNHHRPLTDHPEPGVPSVTDIVQGADLIAHTLGLGHPSGYGSFQNRCEESLNDLWLVLGIPATGKRELLNGTKRAFELEYDIFTGTLGSS